MTFQLRHLGGGVRGEYMGLCASIDQMIEYVRLRWTEHDYRRRYVYNILLVVIDD